MSAAVPLAQTFPELLRPRLLRDVLPFIAVAEDAAVDVDALLGSVGVTRKLLRDPSARLPTHQILALTERLIAEVGDPEIGLRVAERTRLTGSEVLGHLLQHFVQVSPSILTVLDLLARFLTGVSQAARASLTQEDGRVTLRIVPTFPTPPELFDAVAGQSLRLIQSLGGESLRPLEVRLPRPLPARPGHYTQFFGAPVTFDADFLELVYARAALQRSPSQPGELSHGPAASDLTAVPALRTASAFAALVQKQILATLMEGVPSLSAVARRLGVSGRTLRRRLAEARTGYAELVDEVRRRRALILASRAELDVTRLAELSGFADASSFARAFRRWTGQRPAEFMRRARDKA